MKKTFSIFGYEFEVAIKIVDRNPEARVKSLIEDHISSLEYAVGNRKIEIVKFIRRPDVSKILIDAGYVPVSDISNYNSDQPYVCLAWAKEWVDAHYS